MEKVEVPRILNLDTLRFSSIEDNLQIKSLWAQTNKEPMQKFETLGQSLLGFLVDAWNEERGYMAWGARLYGEERGYMVRSAVIWHEERGYMARSAVILREECGYMARSAVIWCNDFNGHFVRWRTHSARTNFSQKQVSASALITSDKKLHYKWPN